MKETLKMKYNVTINGKKYEVEVEAANAASAPAQAPAEKPTVNVPQPSAGSKIVKAPMPGTINDIKVSAGQQVKRGQILVILEAMKMENEILADSDGIVDSISVSKGASVNSGDILMSIK
jgi:biotin carboxyl carrier protein